MLVEIEHWAFSDHDRIDTNSISSIAYGDYDSIPPSRSEITLKQKE